MSYPTRQRDQQSRSSTCSSSQQQHKSQKEMEKDAKEIIQQLRVSELQLFLTEYGQSKVGRKVELQERANQLVSMNIERSMHKRLQQLYSMRVGTSSQGPTQYPSLANPSATRETSSSSNQPLLSMPSLSHLWSQPSALISNSNSRLNHHPVQDWKVPQSVPSTHHHHGSRTTASSGIPETFVERSSYKFNSLPFFEDEDTLISPTNLNPTNAFSPGCRALYQECIKSFTLTVQQANSITSSRKILPCLDQVDGMTPFSQQQTRTEFKHQILVRFSMLSLSGDLKTVEDCFPPSLCVKVNGKIVQLPPALPVMKNQPKEQFRQSRPVDITSVCKLSPVAANLVNISWVHPNNPHNPNSIDYNKKFCFTVCLVKKLSSDDLVSKVKSKGIKAVEFTQSIIKDKLRDEDVEIATTSLRASLTCPLGKMRIRNPGRSTNCTHIQCFDISFFLLMNEKKPTWTCPVCDKKLAFSSLVIDGLFTEILASEKTLSVTEVQFDEVNNSIEWSVIKKEEKKAAIEAKAIVPETLTSSSSNSNDSGDGKRRLDDDSDVGPSKKKKAEPEVIDILSSSDEEAEEGDDDDADTLVGSTISLSRQTSQQSNYSELVQNIVNLSDDEGSPPLDFSSTSNTCSSDQNYERTPNVNPFSRTDGHSLFSSSNLPSSNNSFNPFLSRSFSDNLRSHHGLNPFAVSFNPPISTQQTSPNRNFMSARELLYASYLNRSRSPCSPTPSSSQNSMSNVLGAAFNSLHSSSASSLLNPPPLSLGRNLFNQSSSDEDDDIAIIESS